MSALWPSCPQPVAAGTAAAGPAAAEPAAVGLAGAGPAAVGLAGAGPAAAGARVIAVQMAGTAARQGRGRGTSWASYTLSKRAAMLTRALEAVSATAGVAGAGQAQGEGQGLDRKQVVGWAIDALTLLKGAAGGL